MLHLEIKINVHIVAHALTSSTSVKTNITSVKNAEYCHITTKLEKITVIHAPTKLPYTILDKKSINTVNAEARENTERIGATNASMI